MEITRAPRRHAPPSVLRDCCVDITPSKDGKTHSGYEMLSGLRFERVIPSAPSGGESVRNFMSAAPLEQKTSPVFAFWNT